MVLRLTSRLAIAVVCTAVGIFVLVVSHSLAIADEPPASPRDKPHGNVFEISDWALAGVVWGDASYSKKLVSRVLAETKDKKRAAELSDDIQRLDQIIQEMEQFGWRQLQRPATALAASPGSTTPQLETGSADSSYGASTRIAEAIDKGVEDGPEGPAAAAEIKAFSGLAEKIPSERDPSTSGMPYSRSSIYERYDPGSATPSDHSPSPVLADSNAVNTIVENEVNRLRESEENTIASLQTQPLPSTNLNHYTSMDEELHADANWVQLQLDTNQLRWNMLGNSTISDGMLTDALNHLKARMQLVARITKNPTLKSVLEK
jgi:hypothetical protein